MKPRREPARRIVALVSPTFGGYGGLEAFSLALARGLAEDAETDLRLIFKRVAGFALAPELAEAIVPLGERVRFVERGSGQLARAIRQADVVHAQNPSPDVVCLARIFRRPLLIDVINHRLAGNTLRQRLWDWALRRANRRFYISDFVRRTWEGPQPWTNSEVVFPICDLADGVAPVTARRGFVFAARWIENKGVETLVEAYARAALDPERWPLLLIGDGPLRERIQNQVAGRGLRGVSMPGFVSMAEKAAAIRGARWMVVPPNTNEDFGLTAIEARHLGVPCIITRDGGVPEAAGEEALMCEPGDAAGLAACLQAAAAMSESEYATRAMRTRETLLPRLAGAGVYARAYRELDRR